jgi:glycosyltransferase involved in cell wall biosynthesis
MEKIISIIIPNLNNEDRLFKCLKAVFTQKLDGDHSVEVIVVDNGSSDHSLQAAKQFDVELIVERSVKSPYLCRNIGIKAAKGDIIVLLDSNCIPIDQAWLSAGVTKLLEGERVIVTGPVIFEFSSSKDVYERLDYLYSVKSAEDVDKSTAFPATQLFIPREFFVEIGLFVPHIRSLEDIRWTSKAYSHGIRFKYADDAKVLYPSKSYKQFVKKMIRLGGGKKEQWVSKGNSLHQFKWVWMVFRQFLPPSFPFISKMLNLNKREKMNLHLFTIIIGIWFIKLLRGWGMLTKSIDYNYFR